MPETQAIVEIYGAVDRAVERDRAARLQVAQLLPPYRDPKLQWYDEFQEWLGEPAGAEGSGPSEAEASRPGEAEDIAPGEAEDSGPSEAKGSGPTKPKATGPAAQLERALTELGQTQAEHRPLARRMFAVAIAHRAFPQMSDPENNLRDLAVNVLRTSSTGTPSEGKRPQEHAEALYRLLAGEQAQGVGTAEAEAGLHAPEPPGTKGWWENVVTAAFAQGLMPDEIGMFPRPCTGRLLTVPGANGPVASIEADFTTDKVDFEHATRFLEPVNWKRCMGSFWCEMSEVADNSLPKGQRRYNEFVSTHCGEPNAPGFWAQTELIFEFMWVPNKTNPQAAVANFELAPGRPLPTDRILVDEGTLVVSKTKHSSLRIITTKRVQFSHPFLTDQVALIMCALGYADVTAGLLACAAAFGKSLEGGTDFPGASAISVLKKTGGRQSTRGASGRGQTGPYAPVYDAVDVWAGAMRDSVKAWERGLGGGGRRSRPKKRDRRGG